MENLIFCAVGDLSKQQNTDLKAIQQINLTGNLEHVGNITVVFIIEMTKCLLCKREVIKHAAY